MTERIPHRIRVVLLCAVAMLCASVASIAAAQDAAAETSACTLIQTGLVPVDQMPENVRLRAEPWNQPTEKGGYTRYVPIGHKAWSPDGRYIASQYIYLRNDFGLDETQIIVQIYDLQTGQFVANDPDVIYTVNSLAWSPDSQYLAVTNTVTVKRTEAGQYTNTSGVDPISVYDFDGNVMALEDITTSPLLSQIDFDIRVIAPYTAIWSEDNRYIMTAYSIVSEDISVVPYRTSVYAVTLNDASDGRLLSTYLYPDPVSIAAFDDHLWAVQTTREPTSSMTIVRRIDPYTDTVVFETDEHFHDLITTDEQMLVATSIETENYGRIFTIRSLPDAAIVRRIDSTAETYFHASFVNSGRYFFFDRQNYTEDNTYPETQRVVTGIDTDFTYVIDTPFFVWPGTDLLLTYVPGDSNGGQVLSAVDMSSGEVIVSSESIKTWPSGYHAWSPDGSQFVVREGDNMKLWSLSGCGTEDVDE